MVAFDLQHFQKQICLLLASFLSPIFYIAVNAKYILDFLSMTTSDKIKIGFNESNLPFYLEDNKFITIVMPIVLEK